MLELTSIDGKSILIWIRNISQSLKDIFVCFKVVSKSFIQRTLLFFHSVNIKEEEKKTKNKKYNNKNFKRCHFFFTFMYRWSEWETPQKKCSKRNEKVLIIVKDFVKRQKKTSFQLQIGSWRQDKLDLK